MSAARAIIHGTGATRSADDIDSDLSATTATNIFEKGVVIDTLCDVSIHDEPTESLEESQKELFFSAPRNSIVCRLLTTSQGLSTNSDIVCFPFFSSHFSLPVKPGELVWIYRPHQAADIENSRTYWMSRVSDALQVEDANFAPFSRPHASIQKDPVSPDRELTFPNGTIDEPKIDGDDKALQALIKKSAEAKSVVLEPVPRLTKRPADFTLQGSNNASITLGTDRGWGTHKRPKNEKNSNAFTEDQKQTPAGTIDLVTGRGRYFSTPQSEISRKRKDAATAGISNSTQPFIAKNSFGKFETDKDPAQTQKIKADKAVESYGPPDPGNSKTNPAEGDPDFLVDASRVYVSTDSDIDKKLGLDKIKATGFESKFVPQAGPTVAIKSDHIRIVARKVPLQVTNGNLPEKFDAAAGTIRIIREGNNNEDLASISIDTDGTIQISGPKIFIGRTSEDGGDATGPGPGNSQPYVKYQQLEDLWNDTMDSLSVFCDTVLTHVTPGYGSPSPQLNKAAADLKTKIASNLKKNITQVKSKRIFGE